MNSHFLNSLQLSFIEENTPYLHRKIKKEEKQSKCNLIIFSEWKNRLQNVTFRC